MLSNSDLLMFTGTEKIYKVDFFGMKFFYTDGVQYVIENGQAVWLIQAIFSHQITPKVKREGFQVWRLKKLSNSWELRCTDGGKGEEEAETETGNILAKQIIEYSDFPLDEITLYLENSTLCLPRER